MNPDQPQPMYKCIEIHTSAYYTFACGVPCAHDGTWLRAFCLVVDQIINNLLPPTVLDAGGASGLLVEAQRQYGVEAWKIDASQEAIQNMPLEIQPYCSTNSITELFSTTKVDVIICTEAIECLPPDASEQAIANICQHTDTVMFSSTPFYSGGAQRNVQPPEYWARLFHGFGFHTRCGLRR